MELEHAILRHYHTKVSYRFFPLHNLTHIFCEVSSGIFQLGVFAIPQDLKFFPIELHVVGSGPGEKGVQVLLELLDILLVPDRPADLRVIDEDLDGAADANADVAHVDEEEEGAEYASLGHGGLHVGLLAQLAVDENSLGSILEEV